MTKRILFVCLGNICRSPLAEGILKDKLAKLGKLNSFFVDSCGTSNYNIGLPSDARTIANAARNGIAVNHIARQFTKNDFDEFDLILAMDSNNLRNILSLSTSNEHRNKARLMRSYDSDNKNLEVPDPYYGGEKSFQEVFEILDSSITKLLEKEFNLSLKSEA